MMLNTKSLLVPTALVLAGCLSASPAKADGTQSLETALPMCPE
jgi:hypothetical protein